VLHTVTLTESHNMNTVTHLKYTTILIYLRTENEKQLISIRKDLVFWSGESGE
jgi:hypothetical protein